MRNHNAFRLRSILVFSALNLIPLARPAAGEPQVATTQPTSKPTLAEIDGFAYRPPATTPFHGDLKLEAQYVRAYHAGWNLMMRGIHSTCCEQPRATTEGFYAGQSAAQDIQFRFIARLILNDENSDEIEKKLIAIENSLPLKPVEGWTTPGPAEPVNKKSE